MKAEFKIKKTQVKRIQNSYFISSLELKKAFNLKDEIQNISLYCGRSPEDIEQGVSANRDEWEIQTKEIKEELIKKGGILFCIYS